MTGEGHRPRRPQRGGGRDAVAGSPCAGDRQRTHAADAADGDRAAHLDAVDTLAEQDDVTGGGGGRAGENDAPEGSGFARKRDIARSVERTSQGQVEAMASPGTESRRARRGRGHAADQSRTLHDDAAARGGHGLMQANRRGGGRTAGEDDVAGHGRGDRAIQTETEADRDTVASERDAARRGKRGRPGRVDTVAARAGADDAEIADQCATAGRDRSRQ